MNNNLSLVTIEKNIYIPDFDEDTGKYKDKSPYIPYQRRTPTYQCRCKSGAQFHNNALYKQHVKSETHRHFIENYHNYFKEVDEANKTIKELRIDNEFKNREIVKKNNEIKIMNTEYEKLKTKYSKLKIKLKTKSKTIEKMEKEISILDNQFSDVIN